MIDIPAIFSKQDYSTQQQHTLFKHKNIEYEKAVIANREIKNQSEGETQHQQTIVIEETDIIR